MRLYRFAFLILLFVTTSTARSQPLQWDDLGVAVVTDFAGFTGSGFREFASSGELSSAVFASTGMSDGDCTFSATCLAGDFARGSTSGHPSTGGFYAFEVETGNVALGVQPGGSDFTPGTLTYQIANFAGLVTDVTFSYDLWYYNDQARAQSIYLRWSVNDGAYSKKIDSLSTPTTADVSPGWIKLSRTINLDLGMTVDPENRFNFRFDMDDSTDAPGNRDEIAIDNISSVPFSNLAADLTAFSTLRTDSGVMLRWSTSSESNLDGFEVEQTNPADVFESIGFVSAVGPGSYQFTTKREIARNYRLRMIDFDGTYKYSRTVEAIPDLSEPFELGAPFPNPFFDSSSFTLRVREAQHVNVELYDALGRKLRTLFDAALLADESRRIDVNGNGLSTGIYVYKINGVKFTTTGRIVVGR